MFSALVADEAVNETINDTNKNDFSDLIIDFDKSAKSQLINVINEANNTNIIPIEDDYLVTVALKDTSTYAYAPRRFAWSERLQIRKITDDLLSRGIIKPSVSPYCARVVPVRKRNGSILCIDLRPLNDRVIKQKYPFPLIEDHLARLSNKAVFTLLDLKDGFHHIKLHPDHTKYFAFATPDGQFEFTRLPFGYCEAPAEFQKRLIRILQPLLREDKVLVYIDDILIPSKSIEENLITLREVLLLLKHHDLQLNFKKCYFLRKSIEYLGYMLSPMGISISPRHTEAVRKFPQPTKVVEIQRFLGLANYFRKFIKDYALKARPLQNLLHKTVKFDFNKECILAFETLKRELTSHPVLRLYNPLANTELHTDASTLALAAILLQKQDTGQWAPIAFYSQATNTAEQKFHSFELEMLAIVKSIERFHIYLYGLEFTVITDCHALVYAINKAHLNPRIARWILRLQSYQFKVSHRNGTKMAHVDALSRFVAIIDAMPLEKELEYRQLKDDNLKQIAESLENEENDKFELLNGLVYRKCKDKPHFVIPESMIHNVLRIYHDNMAHCGIEKTVQGISENYWFPSMRKKVQNYIENCLTCLLSNSSINSREGEMQITDVSTYPFHIVHVDHFAPMLGSRKHFKHILLAIDAFTRYTFLFAVKSTCSKETIKHLTCLFQNFGNPQILVSDRGTAFTSQEFKEFLNSRNIRHRLIAVAAPWANGLIERVNRFLKSSLKKILEDTEDWSTKIETVQYVINNTYHSSIKSSPSKLLMGYDQRNHTDTKLVKFLNSHAKLVLDCVESRESSRNLAIDATNKIKEYNKLYYDKRHTKPTRYKQGDYVLIRDTITKPGEEKKFKPSYKGSYLVSKTLNKNRYVITDIPGFNVTQRPYNSILSSDRLKSWIKPITK